MTEAPTVKFPHPTLTPIKGRPDARSVQKLRKEITTNAKAIASTRGGGRHGHYYILLSKTAYLKKTGQNYTIPTHPGEAPTVPDKATSAQIMETNRMYNYRLTDGFAEVEPIDLLDHLSEEYETITSADLDENHKRLEEPWDANEPIEVLWNKLNKILIYAEKGNVPIQYLEIQHKTVQMFQRQGIFTEYIREWNDKEPEDQTWENFQKHFKKAAKYRRNNLTTKQAGYHSNEGDNTGSAFLAEQQKTTIDELKATIQELRNLRNNDSNQKYCVVTDNVNKMYYCWTHGLGTNPRHHSKSCRMRAEGHQEEATAINRMGGSNIIWSGRNKNQHAE